MGGDMFEWVKVGEEAATSQPPGQATFPENSTAPPSTAAHEEQTIPEKSANLKSESSRHTQQSSDMANSSGPTMTGAKYLRFDVQDCHDFISKICGRAEQMPIRYRYYDGCHEILKRLQSRYGPGAYDQYTAVFKTWLKKHEQNESDASIAMWAPWRAEFRITKNFTSAPPTRSAEVQVMAWDSGDGDLIPSMQEPHSQTKSHSNPKKANDKSAKKTSDKKQKQKESKGVTQAQNAQQANSPCNHPKLRSWASPANMKPCPKCGKAIRWKNPSEKLEFFDIFYWMCNPWKMS